MDLYLTKQEFIKEARKLPKKYEVYSIDELANEYCKALDTNDVENKNVYGAALILRFWYTIDKMYKKCKTIDVDRNDILNLLFDCISAACQYRAWQNPDKHTNAQACINQVLATRGVPALYYEANLNKNYHFGEVSLDETLDEESGATRGDLLADKSSEIPGSDGTFIMIQSLIKQNKIIEAIIADNIAHKDVFKHTKTIVRKTTATGEIKKIPQYSSEFWPFKLVQELNLLDSNYQKYFVSRYKVDQSKFNTAVDIIKTANNQKKYRILKKSIESIKQVVLS